MNYVSFWLSSSLGSIRYPRPDVVVASSPPLTVGLTGWWLSRIKKTPFVFDVRDLWPESIVDLTAMTKRSVMVRGLGLMSSFLYNSADKVVVTSEATRDKLTDKKYVEAGKTIVITNGVETQTFHPNRNAEAARKALGLAAKFLVSFIGTIGLAQDLDVVIRTASRLDSDHEHIHLLFVGEGPMKSHAMEAVATLGLSNVTFLPGQKRDDIPGLIQASDVCLVTLRKADVNDVVIPVRMLEFMSCGRPVVLSAAGEARRIVNDAQAGIAVEQGDDSAVAAAIVRLSRDAGLRRNMESNGRQYVVDNFSREKTAIRYLEVLEEVTSNFSKTKGKRQ